MKVIDHAIIIIVVIYDQVYSCFIRAVEYTDKCIKILALINYHDLSGTAKQRFDEMLALSTTYLYLRG